MARRERGRRAGLTREAILSAALDLADREGLQALSMRRLGASLGVEAMALYHHVAGKEALFDGLVEYVFAQTSAQPSGRRDWREWMRAYAGELLATLLAHPNVLPLVVSRPAQTPRNHEAMEHALVALEASGFEASLALDIVYALNGLVVGHAVIAADDDALTAASQAIDAAAYPRFAAASRSDHGAAARFDFALQAMLDGFAAALDRHAT
ncbi:TetR/AcrR family transcriptional regulator C-terminal domain-containing protein [Glycomyces tarimensis]